MTSITSTPPELQGFELVRHLGGGGFADVYLYQQRRPARQVAIKVLKSDSLTAEDRAAFDGEADLMATVSAHPYIVTIFDAGISADGRPFLVMEYYRNEHVGVRAQLGMSVAEALRTGVQVASAVEMLHHHGIVHRDIKPANILVNDLRKPGLTDFGIAGVQGDDPDEESRGASIPYAPPEIVSGRSVGDRRADVYSLGATIYTLLARHTPFETDNPTRAELIQRILTKSVPSLERPDVPRSLELLLQHSMSKDPNQRPQSAAAFALSLQGIERSLGYDPTPLEIPDTEDQPMRAQATPSAGTSSFAPPELVPAQVPSSPSVPLPLAPDSAPWAPSTPVSAPPEGLTVARPVIVVQPPAESATLARPAVVTPAPAPPPAVRAADPAPPAEPLHGSTVARPPAVQQRSEDPATQARVPTVAPAALPPQEYPSSGPRKGLLAAVGLLVVAAAVGGGIVLSSSGGHPKQAATTPSLSNSDMAAAGTPDAPTALKLTRQGSRVLVSWTQGGDVAPDEWRIVRVGLTAPEQVAKQSPYVLAGTKGGQSVCIEISSVVHATGQTSAAVSGCLP